MKQYISMTTVKKQIGISAWEFTTLIGKAFLILTVYFAGLSLLLLSGKARLDYPTEIFHMHAFWIWITAGTWLVYYFLHRRKIEQTASRATAQLKE
jgi:hypothetical protein